MLFNLCKKVGEKLKQFEYKVETIQIQLNHRQDFNEEITKKLNLLGEDGWELTGVNGNIYYFKREKS